MKVQSISGMACDGKSTLIKTLGEQTDGSFIFLEHVGGTLEFSKNVIGNPDDFINLQSTVIMTEIQRIQFLRYNKKLFENKTIFLDRNVLDTLAFTYYHRYRTKKIKNIPSKLIENFILYIKKHIEYFPMYDSIILIEPCKNNDFILKNCLREDRINTINIDQFIDDGKYWFKIFVDIYNFINDEVDLCARRLSIISHPSEIGFDEFYKQIFEELDNGCKS